MISRPRGFVLVDATHADLQRIAEEATPPANRLLAQFARRADLRARSQGKETGFNRYFLAQTLRKIEDRAISAADFAQLRSATRKQQSEILGKLEPRLAEVARILDKRHSDGAGKAVSLRIGDVVPLGIQQDSESFVSFGAMSRLEYQGGASTDDRTVVNVAAIVTVKGKVLFLYTYARFTSPKDIEWAKHASATWTNDVLAANR